VKPAPPLAAGRRAGCRGGPGTADPVTLDCGSFSLSYLVMMAYNLRVYQLSAPGWMDTERYDVAARIAAGTDAARFRTMLQNLLGDRFGLKSHLESRQMAGFEMSLVKGESKLHPAADLGSAEDPPWTPPPAGPPMAVMAAKQGKAESMARLAAFVADQLRRPVVDGTGLAGRYDYMLSFLMDPAGAGTSAETSPDKPDLIEALRDQLGLRLERKTVPVQVLVVDSAGKFPTN